MIKYGDIFADVAELVDALDLGSSVFDVWVRVPPSALTLGSMKCNLIWYWRPTTQKENLLISIFETPIREIGIVKFQYKYSQI